MESTSERRKRKHKTISAMRSLHELGQSVWLDDLQRRMTRSGELALMVHDGLRGMTSNPSTFERAIAGGEEYDGALAEIASSQRTDTQILEALMIQDVQEAADTFASVYRDSDGRDGFVSMEVSPYIARDPAASIAEARRLWLAVDRPNVMIKIPGTREGWPAIEECLTEGININITLLFSMEHYRAVAEAYMHAVERRLARDEPIDRVASVASLFISRIDTEIDKRLAARGDANAHLRGRAGIANARLVYAEFLEITASERWRALAAQGARPQRVLWASTGTKNPAYSDVLYVESLIGADTITTLPPETLRAFEEHGEARRTLPGDISAARAIMAELQSAGIEFAEAAATLESQGIEKFASAQDSLLSVIRSRRHVSA